MQGQLLLRFAEPDGKFEKSPGHLDKLTLPLAWRVQGTNPPVVLDTSKQTNHFLIADSKPADSVQIETVFQVMKAPGKPGRRPNFYARWHPAGAGEAQPALVLDLVPTGESGKVRVYFRGNPLGGIKATLRTPDEKEQELTADDQGFLKFNSKQSGQHLLTIAHHRETLAGYHLGSPYELTSHNAALTWVQP